MYGKYIDIVLSNFSGGLNTKFDDNQIDNSESPDMQNIDFNGRNSFGPRMGKSIFGTSSANVTNGSAIASVYCIKNRKGDEFPLRQFGNTVQYYNPTYADWTQLKNDFTAGYPLAFEYYGSASLDDFVYMANGKDNMWAWHPRCGVVSGAVSASDTVIYLSTSTALSTLGWLSAGSAIINNEAVYYASLSSNALSSITRSSANANANSGDPIAQYPISSGYTFIYKGVTNTYNLSAAPKGNILKVFQGRMFIAGVSSAPETVQYSMIDNPWDYKYNSVLSAGDGGIFSFAEGGGPVTGLANKDDKLLVYKRDFLRYMAFTTDDLPYPGTVLEGTNLGTLLPRTIIQVESDIFHLSPIGIVRNLIPNQQSTGFTIAQKSIKIQPTLQSVNLQSAAAHYYNSKYYISVATSASSFNDKVYYYDYAYDAWGMYAGVNATNYFEYKGNLYYGSSNENACYQLMTNYDDTGNGYEVHWNSKRIDFGVPNEYKRMRYVYVEGYLTTNTTIRVDAYYDGNNSPITKYISGSGSYVDITDELDIIGQATLGVGTYGGINTGQTYNLYKFRVRLSYDNVDFFNVQFKFSTDQPGYVWKVNYIVPYVQTIDGKKFNPNSII